jgi:hypothetical protein
MLITTSGCSSTFFNVSFVSLDRPDRAGEKINMGGFALNTLKKLKGARFGRPCLSTVDAKAMGRGLTPAKR